MQTINGQIMIKMKKIIIPIIAAILIIIAIIFIATYEKPKIGHEYFSLEPTDWIQDNENTDESHPEISHDGAQDAAHHREEDDYK